MILPRVQGAFPPQGTTLGQGDGLADGLLAAGLVLARQGEAGLAQEEASIALGGAGAAGACQVVEVSRIAVGEDL